jgi:hypothetical protein
MIYCRAKSGNFSENIAHRFSSQMECFSLGSIGNTFMIFLGSIPLDSIILRWTAFW